MPYQILASHFGTPELVIIAVCLTICFLIIKFWRYVEKWYVFVISFFLSAGLSILIFRSDNLWITPLNLFLLNIVASSSRLAFTIVIPILIKGMVKRQIGVSISFIVAFFSAILGNLLVAFVLKGLPVLYDPITIILYAVASYKIMRSYSVDRSYIWLMACGLLLIPSVPVFNNIKKKEIKKIAFENFQSHLLESIKEGEKEREKKYREWNADARRNPSVPSIFNPPTLNQ